MRHPDEQINIPYASGPHTSQPPRVELRVLKNASAAFDVYVETISLGQSPATIETVIRVGSLRFRSAIIYHSIPRWSDLGLLDEQLHQLVAAIVAWDSMRFMALGGSQLLLPAPYSADAFVRQMWHTCFLHQFGEWRFRNRFGYGSTAGPALIAAEPTGNCPLALDPVEPTNRSLVTNGGGKDTLAGLLLLKEAGEQYDLYAGITPIGGSAPLQHNLLRRLSDVAVADGTNEIAVTVEDDFYDRPEEDFSAAGIFTDHFKTDFAVGHTANYVGLFPLVLAHRYRNIWFNIERSAERPMVIWGDEEINHQWCKSSHYQRLALSLFEHLTGHHWFKGFSSTLGALYDTAIYRIVSKFPQLLRRTHSCNYGKPWCSRCPKCCFCYLMMTAALGEEYAKSVVGISHSLFDDACTAEHWENLLDSTKVAWECVASSEECRLAAYDCINRGVLYPILRQFAPTTTEANRLRAQYNTVYWSDVPPAFRRAVAALTA